jgi:hypothetical protein
MVLLILGMLVCIGLAALVVALVAIPARREGREVLTPTGEEVVSAVRNRTDNALNRTGDAVGTARSRTGEAVTSARAKRSGGTAADSDEGASDAAPENRPENRSEGRSASGPDDAADGDPDTQVGRAG